MSLLENPEELEVLQCLDDQGGEGSLPLHLVAYADRMVEVGWLIDLTTFSSVDDEGKHVRVYLLGRTGRSVLAAEPDDDPKGKPAKNVKKNVNGRMLDKMSKDKACHGWTSTQWAKFLKCAKSSVVDTDTWKGLKDARMDLKASHMKDRHRKPKGSDQRRAADQD